MAAQSAEEQKTVNGNSPGDVSVAVDARRATDESFFRIHYFGSCNSAFNMRSEYIANANMLAECIRRHSTATRNDTLSSLSYRALFNIIIEYYYVPFCIRLCLRVGVFAFMDVGC